MLGHECGGVSLRISSSDSVRTATPSRGDSVGGLIVYEKWSSNERQLWRVAGAVNGRYVCALLTA